MQVNKVRLSNFRNYSECELNLERGRNILVGENAQGKTNFLEAIEFLSTAKSARADQDVDLIKWQAPHMVAHLEYGSRQGTQELRVAYARDLNPENRRKVEKKIGVNGVTQKSISDLIGRLLVVSFSTQDLYLLRGGPKYRRDWIDSLVVKLRPSLLEVYANYKKCLAQRNKLLKSIFERGKVTVTDQDQLLVWDKQLSRFGARVIKERLAVLARLLPIAEEQQSRISREREELSIRYVFKSGEMSGSYGGSGSDGDDEEDESSSDNEVSTGPLNAAQLAAMSEDEIAATLMRLLKERRATEIRRKQTSLGPHRDDLIFCLNDRDAISFASQGQQRSIVLSLKLAELALVRETLDEAPVLLLDDVLAELDEFRQGLLMSVVEQDMQTIITTTHVSGFHPRWLEDAAIFRVHDGRVERLQPLQPGYVEHVISG
jgi:DNA replication and repair protein RecF